LKFEISENQDTIRNLQTTIKEFQYSIDTYKSKESSLKSERDHYKSAREEKDSEIHSLKKEMIYLKTSIEEHTDTISSLKQELNHFREKFTSANEARNALKEANQQLELQIRDLQREAVSSSKEAVRSWEGLQAKYQGSLQQLEEGAQVIQRLRGKVDELKDINREMDTEWGKKYQSMSAEKEATIQQLKEDIQSITSKLMQDKESSVSEVTDKMKSDIIMMDKGFTAQLNAEKQKVKSLKAQCSELWNKLEQIKDVLKLSEKSINKKTAIIEGLREAIAANEKKIASEKLKLDVDKEALAQEKADILGKFDSILLFYLINFNL
jgi:chromosome segregation ATPase